MLAFFEVVANQDYFLGDLVALCFLSYDSFVDFLLQDFTWDFAEEHLENFEDHRFFHSL